MRHLPLIALLLGMASRPAVGHVKPEQDVNNRFMKLTLMGDRVRLLYTVYLGEQPGAQARVRLDRNRDGQLSDAEVAPLEQELADAVAGGVRVTIDGQKQPIEWAERHMGLGQPITDAGSLSLDLVAWLCAPAGSEHQLVVYDRYRIPLPGTTEVRVEESPGVTVERSTIGGQGQSLLELRWRGADNPLTSDGLHVRYRVEDAPPVDARCVAAASPGDTARREASWGWLIAAGAAGLLLIGAAALLVARRNRNQKRGAEAPRQDSENAAD